MSGRTHAACSRHASTPGTARDVGPWWHRSGVAPVENRPTTPGIVRGSWAARPDAPHVGIVSPRWADYDSTPGFCSPHPCAFFLRSKKKNGHKGYGEGSPDFLFNTPYTRNPVESATIQLEIAQTFLPNLYGRKVSIEEISY